MNKILYSIEGKFETVKGTDYNLKNCESNFIKEAIEYYKKNILLNENSEENKIKLKSFLKENSNIKINEYEFDFQDDCGYKNLSIIKAENYDEAELEVYESCINNNDSIYMLKEKVKENNHIEYDSISSTFRETNADIYNVTFIITENALKNIDLYSKIEDFLNSNTKKTNDLGFLLEENSSKIDFDNNPWEQDNDIENNNPWEDKLNNSSSDLER